MAALYLKWQALPEQRRNLRRPHSTEILEVFTLEGFASRYYFKSFTGGWQPLDLSPLGKKSSVEYSAGNPENYFGKTKNVISAMWPWLGNIASLLYFFCNLLLVHLWQVLEVH